jgi:hypothetical protein
MWSGDMKDIFIVVFATLTVCFALSYMLVLKQSIKLKKDISKLFIENTLLQEYVDLTKSTKIKEDSDDSIHKENFIKFLSDSRDWAFLYIESVQKGLTKFVSDVDADVSHFDEYGDALSMSRPDYPSMKNISKAYKELKTLLPEENTEIDSK